MVLLCNLGHISSDRNNNTFAYHMEDEIITYLNMSVEAKGTWNIERKGSFTYGMLANISLNLILSQ